MLVPVEYVNKLTLTSNYRNAVFRGKLDSGTLSKFVSEVLARLPLDTGHSHSLWAGIQEDTYPMVLMRARITWYCPLVPESTLYVSQSLRGLFFSVFFCISAFLGKLSDMKSTWSSGPASHTQASLSHELWKVPRNTTAPTRPPPGLSNPKPSSTWGASPLGWTSSYSSGTQMGQVGGARGLGACSVCPLGMSMPVILSSCCSVRTAVPTPRTQEGLGQAKALCTVRAAICAALQLPWFSPPSWAPVCPEAGGPGSHSTPPGATLSPWRRYIQPAQRAQLPLWYLLIHNISLEQGAFQARNKTRPPV